MRVPTAADAWSISLSRAVTETSSERWARLKSHVDGPGLAHGETDGGQSDFPEAFARGHEVVAAQREAVQKEDSGAV